MGVEILERYNLSWRIRNIYSHVSINVADATTILSLDMGPVIVSVVAIARISVRSPSIGTTSKCEAN